MRRFPPATAHPWNTGRIIRAGISTILVPFLRRTVLQRRVHTDVLGVALSVEPGVFHPSLYFSSTFLAGHIRSLDLSRLRVLDIGTGSGVLAIHAALRDAMVVAIDTNPAAVACARSNVQKHDLGRNIEVYQSDLFREIPVSVLFDYIFWNPPFYQRPPVDAASAAWNAGLGYSVLRRFAGEAVQHLTLRGKIVMVFSEEMDVKEILRFFLTEGLTSRCVASRRRMFEAFRIYEFARTPRSQ